MLKFGQQQANTGQEAQKMVTRINIRDVKVNWLNVRCLTLISKYVQEANKNDGVVINLRDPDVLQQVMEHAKHTNSEQLRNLYMNLRMELRFNLSEQSVADQIAAESTPVSLSSRPADRAARFLRF